MNNISTRRKQARRLPIIFCACLSLLIGGSVFARQHYAPSPEEQDRLAGLRYAALHNDHSKVPELLKALHTPHETYIATALHGLEHLQALEALPDIEAFIQETKTGYAYEQARAARARLLAESEAGNTTRKLLKAKTPRQSAAARLSSDEEQRVASIKVQRLLQEMHTDTKTVAANMEIYYRAKQKGDVGWSADVHILNELADMAYHGSYAAYAALPEFKALDFSKSSSAALKLKYAPLDGRHRVRQIIDDLSHTGESGALLQLGIDEGLPASRAAADKLADIEANRENYAVVIEGRTYHPGVLTLFRLIASVGDKDQAPLLERFTQEHDDIATYALQELGHVRRGLRKQSAPGY